MGARCKRRFSLMYPKSHRKCENREQIWQKFNFSRKKLVILKILQKSWKIELKIEDGSKMGAKTPKMEAKLPEMEQKGASLEPEGPKREPKGSQKGPKGSQKGPKGSQREAKGSQRATKIRRPSVRRVRPLSRRDLGGGLPPPYPLRWGGR